MKVERAPVPAGPLHYLRQSVVVDGIRLNYVSAGSGRPVVLIHGNPGSPDRLLDPQQQAYRLHRTIKNSKLIVLADTRHQLPQTRPDTVISAIDAVWAAT